MPDAKNHGHFLACSIRPGLVEELPAVQEIVRSAYGRYIARIGREPGPMTDDYAKLIEAGFLYVAERDGVVSGLVVLIPRHDAMLLDNVAVAPQVQGTGLGRLLLDFAEKAAVSAGYRVVELYTNEAMVENIALYTRIGYAETHRVEEKGLRRVYMRKHLAR